MEKLFNSIPNLAGQNVSLTGLTIADLENIKQMISCDDIYRYVPPFVPELQCNGDIEYFINTMCKELFDKKVEIILGIYSKNYNNQLCGLFELYHYIPTDMKVSIGYRLAKEFWNKGIATEATSLIVNYLFKQTDITTISAGNMVDNLSSGIVLEKNGFSKIGESVFEDWGFSQKVYSDKWILKKSRTN